MNIHERSPYDPYDRDPNEEHDDRWVVPMAVLACLVCISGIGVALLGHAFWGFLIVLTPFTVIGIVVAVLSFR